MNHHLVVRIFLTSIFFLLSQFVFIAGTFGQKNDFIFKRINADHGLSNGLVKCIVQDYQGFMWFATENGLNRYNGYSIKIYQNNPLDSNSLRFNDVYTLFEDSRKNLWIGTHKGVDVYERPHDHFIHHDEIQPFRVRSIIEDGDSTIWVSSGSRIYYKRKGSAKFKEVKHDDVQGEILHLYIDKEETLWVGTSAGLYTLDMETERLVSDPQLTAPSVQVMKEDFRGNLWAGSISDGLLRIDRKNRRAEKYLTDRKLDAYSVLSIHDSEDGKLWLGAENRGLIVYDYEKDSYYRYTTIEGDEQSLSFNSVNTICKDQSGNMWLGTYMGGVNFMMRRNFLHINSRSPEGKRTSNDNILSFCEDKNGKIWIGTDGGGLNVMDRNTGTIRSIMHDDDDPASLPNNYVTSVAEDREGTLWVGLWAGGIAKYNRNTGKFINYRHVPGDDSSLVYDGVVYVFADKDSDIWVSTPFGFDRFDRKTEKFIHYDFVGISAKNHVRSIYEDDENNLWLCTVGGLLIYNKTTGEVKEYSHIDSANSISNDFVMSLFVDSKNRIWVCTAGGLNLFDKVTETFTIYNQNNYLPDETIYGALEDEKGNLWLSTSKGICRFNPDTKQVRNFTVSDGLQGNQFREHAALKLSSGEMLFGGTNGFNILTPGKIVENDYVPPVVFTRLSLFNKTVDFNTKGSPLKKDISLTDELALSYEESVFSLEFAALNYAMPEKNQYAYKMQGFDKDWNYVGNKRSATYTNLDPGTYTFMVKASNNDGIWNEQGKSIRIIITPPFWQTWWFRFIAGVLIIFSGIFIYNFRMRAVKRHNELLEKQVQDRTFDLEQAGKKLVAQKIELEEQAKDLSLHAQELKAANEKIASDNRKIEILFREVKDSIRAAEVIQSAVLPTSLIQSVFPESFILYKPKDVVSGDFYWYRQVKDHHIIAVADCTGHGVSGALMSINAHHLLNRVVGESAEGGAAGILNRLNNEFIKDLRQGNGEDLWTEGMEISLCILNEEKKEMQFAGSGNSLYVLRGGEIIQVKADRFTIGMKVQGNAKAFTNKDIELQKGDCIYLFTDGYPDQFGGEKGDEKFMYRRFRELLLTLENESMENQKIILDEAFEKWRNDTEQTDDVLVAGLKI